MSRGWERLEVELQRLKQVAGMADEVGVEWIPGAEKYHNGRRLKEEVKRDTIFIYVEDEHEALELVRHGFHEWLLNQYSKPYRQMINKLITLFEEQQYLKKEKIIQALTKLMEDDRNTQLTKHKNNLLTQS